jgi:prepilin-type N-terminal cleavage/methylation domain-containing protein
MRRSEDGFTLIEVLVAMAIALISIGALADLFSNGQTASVATQRQSELVTVAQQQIEQLREEVKVDGFSALAMSSAPTVSTDPTNPDYYLTNSASSYYIASNWNGSTGTSGAAAANIATYAGTTAGSEPLCTSSSGGVSPTAQTVSEGSNTIQVWTIVTQTTVGPTASVNSPCTDDSRRVIVAARFVNSGTRQDQGPTTPLYISTIFTNPIPTNQASGAVGISLGVGGINLG